MIPSEYQRSMALIMSVGHEPRATPKAPGQIEDNYERDDCPIPPWWFSFRFIDRWEFEGMVAEREAKQRCGKMIRSGRNPLFCELLKDHEGDCWVRR